MMVPISIIIRATTVSYLIIKQYLEKRINEGIENPQRALGNMTIQISEKNNPSPLLSIPLSLIAL